MKTIDQDTRMAFVDVETTGIDPKQHHLLEVAVVITEGPQLDIIKSIDLLTLPAGISLDQVRTEANDFAAQIHAETGLWDELATDEDICEHSFAPGNPLDAQLCEFLDRHGSSSERMLMGGNSVGFDRAYLDRCAPNFMSRLHYRSFDVTSNSYFASLLGINTVAEARTKHRAIDDLMAAIETTRLQRQAILSACLQARYSIVTGHPEQGRLQLESDDPSLALRFIAAMAEQGVDAVVDDGIAVFEPRPLSTLRLYQHRFVLQVPFPDESDLSWNEDAGEW